MISDTLSAVVAEVRRYQDDPVFAEVYEPLDREIEIVLYFVTALQAVLDSTDDVLRSELLTQIRQAAPSFALVSRRVDALKTLHGGSMPPGDPVRYTVLYPMIEIALKLGQEHVR
jgi:hypothetical protein